MDVHSKETRSYNMSRIRSKDTRPEMLVRKFLHKMVSDNSPTADWQIPCGDLASVMDLCLMADQPTTCPICGVRTDIIADFYYTNLKLFVNECLNVRCKHVFLEVEPESPWKKASVFGVKTNLF